MVKLTLSLDENTVRTLRALGVRQRKPQSHVVREAIAVYAAQGEKLNEQERARKLRVLDQLAAAAPTRPEKEVDAALHAARRARRTGWKRTSE